MALIGCEECKKQISDKAEKCPHCGAPVGNYKIAKEKKWHEKTAVTLLIAAILIIVGLGFVHIVTGRQGWEQNVKDWLNKEAKKQGIKVPCKSVFLSLESLHKYKGWGEFANGKIVEVTVTLDSLWGGRGMMRCENLYIVDPVAGLEKGLENTFDAFEDVFEKIYEEPLRETTERPCGAEAFKGRMVWVKCSNPDCRAEYEMDMAEYFGQVEEAARANPGVGPPTPIVCKKCGEESLYRAVKCAKCGKIFFYGSAGAGDFPDRCECGYSKTEDDKRKSAEAAASQKNEGNR